MGLVQLARKNFENGVGHFYPQVLLFGVEALPKPNNHCWYINCSSPKYSKNWSNNLLWRCWFFAGYCISWRPLFLGGCLQSLELEFISFWKFSKQPEPEVLFDFQILKKKTRVTQNYVLLHFWGLWCQRRNTFHCLSIENYLYFVFYHSQECTVICECFYNNGYGFTKER